MIWVILTLLVLSYVFFFALIRVAALSDESIARRSDIEDSHLRVVRGVYDHEAGGDFDDD